MSAVPPDDLDLFDDEIEPVTLAASAYEYAAEGWPIFPLKPRTKVPLTEHGFKDATTDLAQVRRWWDKYPNANIAVQTGVLFDVIDVDGHNGFRTLAPYIEKHGPLHAGCITTTPGKVKNGVHVGTGAHYYVAVTKLPYQDFGGNLEMKAAGGYIVVPPSIHPDGTGTYQWAHVQEIGSEFPPAPPWVFEHAQRKDAARKAELAEREARRRERPASDGESIMERFNAGASWQQLLEGEGWKYLSERGDNTYWSRPGHEHDTISASVSDGGDGVLYVFSDATQFEPATAYSKFAFYAITRHGGDFRRAAKTLAEWWRKQEAS